MRGEIWSFGRGRSEPVPLAVVSAEALNNVAPTVVGVVVTSRSQRAGEPLAVALDPQTSGLGAPAWLKVTQVHTVPASDARERIGQVPPEVMLRLDAALVEVLGLPGGVSR